MKRLTLTTTLLFLIACSIFAQQKDKTKNPDYTNYYQPKTTFQTDAVTISFEDVVSKTAYCKLKIRIKNNTGDYIIFKSYECVFKLPQGDYTATDKMIIIKPYESDFKVLDIKGNGQCLVDSFSLIVNGLYRFAPNAVIQIVPNFFLPPSINAFPAGPFTCALVDIKKETQETWVRFDCQYNGDNAGIIDPSMAVVRLDNGQEFANARPNMKPSILMRGESDKFSLNFNVPVNVADMQVANMQIVWKTTFIDSQIIPLSPGIVDFIIDKGKTQTKNK